MTASGTTPGGHTMLRVAQDDPEYRRLAAAETAFWQDARPSDFEAVLSTYAPGPVDRYLNRHFTEDENLPWYETIHLHGDFRSGAVLGASMKNAEERILSTNPSLRLTFFDLSAGPLARRQEEFGAKYPGRVETRIADLNFVNLPSNTFDLIVSSSTIHHVTNLESLADQINRALAPGGLFFLEDYVGERKCQFSAEKRKAYEEISARDRRRRGVAPCDIVWHDSADLSPFCSIRSDDILQVFRTHLQEVRLQLAGALVTPLARSHSADAGALSPWVTDEWVRQARWQYYWGRLRQRLPGVFGKPSSIQDLLDPRFLDELFLVGDVLAAAGLLLPAQAFAIYRKRKAD